MSAHPGNRYAEKWTRENTLHALESLRLESEKTDCLYLGMALHRAGYYSDLWAYWRRKWRTDRIIMSIMKRILQAFESRLFEKTATGHIPVRVGMFALSHHYGWGREPKTTVADQYREPDFEPEELFDEDYGYSPQQPAGTTGREEGMTMEHAADSYAPSPNAQIAAEVQYILAERTADGQAPTQGLDADLRSFYAEMINQYNVEHPQSMITHLMAYLPGPPDTPDGIPFDGGHFAEL